MPLAPLFENLVNYDKSKTEEIIGAYAVWFENLVNYDKSKTISAINSVTPGLRTL